MNSYDDVREYMSDLDPLRRTQAETLRKYILSAEPMLTEHIKWNAPSYLKDGEDRITFNTVNKDHVVKLVFHMGAKRQEDKLDKPVLEDTKLIEWVSNIRGYMTFREDADLQADRDIIMSTVKDWLKIT